MFLSGIIAPPGILSLVAASIKSHEIRHRETSLKGTCSFQGREHTISWDLMDALTNETVGDISPRCWPLKGTCSFQGPMVGNISNSFIR